MWMPSFLVVVVTLTSDPCPSCSTGGVNVPPGGIDDVEPEEQPFVKPKGEAEHMWPVHLLKGMDEHSELVKIGLMSQVLHAMSDASSLVDTATTPGVRGWDGPLFPGTPRGRPNRQWELLEATRDESLAAETLLAFESLEATAQLALARWRQRFLATIEATEGIGGGVASGWNAELVRVQAHIVSENSSFVHRHTSLNPRGVSGIYVLEVPKLEAACLDCHGSDRFLKAGDRPAVLFDDPRGNDPYIESHLPHHMQPNEKFKWEMREGEIMLFPGEVPRETTCSSDSSKGTLVLISFDFEPIPNPTNGLCQTSYGVPGHCADSTEALSLEIIDRGRRLPRAFKREVLRPYSLTGGGGGASLIQVEDIMRWGTPVALLQTEAGTGTPVELNTMLASEIASLREAAEDEDGVEEGRVFQTDKGRPLFGAARVASRLFGGSATMTPGFELLEELIVNSVKEYMRAEPDCMFLNGPEASADICHHLSGVHGMYKKEPVIAVAWANSAAADERSVNQESHHHIGLRPPTAITGVYYVDSGWSSDDQDSEFGRFLPPDHYGRGNATMLGLTRPTTFDGFGMWSASSVAALRPRAGTIIIFPTWLRHAADVHLGDRQRMSISFNVILRDPDDKEKNGMTAPSPVEGSIDRSIVKRRELSLTEVKRAVKKALAANNFDKAMELCAYESEAHIRPAANADPGTDERLDIDLVKWCVGASHAVAARNTTNLEETEPISKMVGGRSPKWYKRHETQSRALAWLPPISTEDSTAGARLVRRVTPAAANNVSWLLESLLRPELPFVVEADGGDIVGWPASAKWTDPEQLMALYGDMIVKVATHAATDSVLMKLREFGSSVMENPGTRADPENRCVFQTTNADHAMTKDWMYPAIFAQRNGSLNHFEAPSEHVLYTPPCTSDDPEVTKQCSGFGKLERWEFYLGPALSGTYPHVHSGAWNALIAGEKRWLLWPPHQAPSFMGWSQEGGSAALPMRDWLRDELPNMIAADPRLAPFVVEQKQGELFFVPFGWVHAVLNLQPSIGVSAQVGAPKTSKADVATVLKGKYL